MSNKRNIIFIFIISLVIGTISLNIKASLIVTGIILLLISFFLIYKATGTVIIPTFPLIYFVFYVLLIYLGSFQIFFENNMDNPKYFIATNLTLLLFPLGTWLANIILKYKPRTEVLTYIKKPIVKVSYDFKNIFLFIFLLLISISFSLLYLYRLPQIPLISAIKNPGEQFNISKAREAATILFPGKFHWYRFFFSDVLSLLSIMLFVKALTSPRYRKTWKLIASSLILLTSFMLLIDMRKAPIIIYSLSLIIAFIIIKGGLKFKHIIVFGLITLFFLAITYSLWTGLFVQTDTIKEKILALVPIYNRIVLGQTRALYWYFKIFQTSSDFLMGKSFPNPGGILPYEPISLTRYVYNIVFPQSKIEGSMPTVFFGEIYANFGYYIMFLSVLLLGLILQSVQIYFIRRPKTILSVSFMAFLVIYVKNLTATSLFQVFNIFLLILIFLIILFRIRFISSSKAI